MQSHSRKGRAVAAPARRAGQTDLTTKHFISLSLYQPVERPAHAWSTQATTTDSRTLLPHVCVVVAAFQRDTCGRRCVSGTHVLWSSLRFRDTCGRRCVSGTHVLWSSLRLRDTRVVVVAASPGHASTSLRLWDTPVASVANRPFLPFLFASVVHSNFPHPLLRRLTTFLLLDPAFPTLHQ